VSTGAVRWLEPLLPSIPGLGGGVLARISRFDDALTALLDVYPVDYGLDQEARSFRLCLVRQRLSTDGLLALAVPARHGGHGHPAVLQALLQFTCGYHDVNLRDSTGLGHGQLIADHATPQARDRWVPRILAGAVPGIAITESHGGTRVHATATHAVAAGDGTWQVTGVKTWISRLTEAAVFCLFFTAPCGQLTAAALDSGIAGLSRRLITPAGLSGWAWGELRLDHVTIRPCDILGQPGNGMRLLRDHFATYRPLVAATALGAAAAVHDHASALLASRRQDGTIPRVRDSALITLGRTWAQVNAALLAAVTAHQLASTGHLDAETWGCGVKAHAADIAYQAASELALLEGAAGFTASSLAVKVRADLNALLYADGIHDSLYRSAGRNLISSAAPALPATATAPVPQPRDQSNQALAST
jgi:alkylation response protein AidB-like acyl-CoA dehydrogenase